MCLLRGGEHVVRYRVSRESCNKANKAHDMGVSPLVYVGGYKSEFVLGCNLSRTCIMLEAVERQDTIFEMSML